MTRNDCYLAAIILCLAISLFVARKAAETTAQPSRIEALCGHRDRVAYRDGTTACVENIATPPIDLTVEPAAPSDVRVAICEAGYDHLRIGTTIVNAARSCARQLPRPNATIDVLVGPASLAAVQVCNGWAAGTPCPESQACAASLTPAHFLCRCGGSGWSITRDGTRTIEGLFMSWRGIDASGCPPQLHNGCAIILTMTRAQFHILRAVATDDDVDAYPAGIKALVDLMRLDPYRAQSRDDVPACLRTSVPVRMGRSDIDGRADFDGVAP